MNDIDINIYAANIHSFIFQIQTGIDENFQPLYFPREWVNNTYQTIIQPFPDFTEKTLDLRKDTPKASRFSLFTESKRGLLFSSQNLNPKTNKPYRKLLVYPQQIADSYVLSLNFYIPQTAQKDNIKLEQLKEFNPDHCLQINTKLGQTFLITAFLDPNITENKEKIANQCLHHLLNLSLEEIQAKFYRKGELFNSEIIEYGNPKLDQFHALILFFAEESSSENFNKIYWELPSLLLYHHKIITAYADSRLDYHELDKKVSEIDRLISSFNSQPQENQILSSNELEDFNQKLKQLLNLSLDYSRKLRNLEYYQNTIAIHSSNYQTKLNYLQKLTNNNLDFFASLCGEEWTTLQTQIKADLNYFHQGTIILNQGIETIRGLIEIDQAKSDRLKEAREKEKDIRLQITILAIGSGLAVAGIVATSYPLITPENPLLPPSFRPLHPFSTSVILSLICAILAYLLIELIAIIIRKFKKFKA
ncbi:hypothetical protein [Gloeothece verrucosa]|uniref:Uncharacterized protein n=1 Tax=Gloeothece verrucosa (strain PCC 7822) TaxID=497965 RepID=E0U8B1_GLOV7|nr:hypothetical protein [Gloeothece verrucosa]ADN12547.1 conserved hypothetical protein [Gloeothece verrucosa PCC 7822]